MQPDESTKCQAKEARQMQYLEGELVSKGLLQRVSVHLVTKDNSVYLSGLKLEISAQCLYLLELPDSSSKNDLKLRFGSRIISDTQKKSHTN